MGGTYGVQPPTVFLFSLSLIIPFGGQAANIEYVRKAPESAIEQFGLERIKLREREKTQDFQAEENSCATCRNTILKNTRLVRNHIPCETNATSITVQVKEYDGAWDNFYNICFDEKTSRTLYSQSFIDGKAHSDGDSESGNRPTFRDPHCYFPFNVSSAYSRIQERLTLSKLLGGPEMVEKYIPKDHYFLNRGHLFPNGDPFYKYQKDSTFLYLNAVPQWQILNAGNWERIERSVRVNLATNLGIKLKVWTGTYGTLSLKDKNDNDVELWLGLENQFCGPHEEQMQMTRMKNDQRLPVPKFFWKVAFDERGKAAIAFVQVNNPWAKITSEDILCNDICDQLSFLTIDTPERKIVRRGYTYCCDVNSLRKKIPIIPEIQYNRILNAEVFSDEGSSESEE